MLISLAYVMSQATSRYAEPHRTRPDSASGRFDGTCHVCRSLRESTRGESRDTMHHCAAVINLTQVVAPGT